MHTSVLCMSMHVCHADQMLLSHLQGALISCMFTVTHGQQGASRPAAGQARMNGTAYKGQHPQGSQQTRQPDHYSHAHTLVGPVSTNAESIMMINPHFSRFKVYSTLDLKLTIM